MFLKKKLKYSLSFESLPPLISGLNPKFEYSTVCVLNRNLARKNFVFKSYLYQKLSRKKFGSRLPLPPPPPQSLDQKGLTLFGLGFSYCLKVQEGSLKFQEPFKVASETVIQSSPMAGFSKGPSIIHKEIFRNLTYDVTMMSLPKQ